MIAFRSEWNLFCWISSCFSLAAQWNSSPLPLRFPIFFWRFFGNLFSNIWLIRTLFDLHHLPQSHHYYPQYAPQPTCFPVPVLILVSQNLYFYENAKGCWEFKTNFSSHLSFHLIDSFCLFFIANFNFHPFFVIITFKFQLFFFVFQYPPKHYCLHGLIVKTPHCDFCPLFWD